MPYTFKHGDRPIDGLTIQRAVGRGGFGEVYYALTDSGKQIAVKYLRDNPEVELRGIAHVMNLKSPYLITIYDVRHGERGEPYVIMEYVSGPSLRDVLIAEPSGLGPQKTAFFIKGIAQGLSYLHERGIVHRDLKPGNIFYDDGYVKIGDYGLSKHIAVSAHSGNTISVGTVHYMAPEIGSGSYSKSIDIYALGVMLYEMLTGRLPFAGSSMGEVLMRHLSDKPDLSGIAEPFASVIAKALAKDPNDRYQDVNEMLEELICETEISESIASFDASVLTRTQPGEADFDPDRTLTRAPQAPITPVLDARVAAGPAPVPPPIPPVPPSLDKKSAKKAHKLRKKLEKQAIKAEAARVRLAAMGIGSEDDVRQTARPVRGAWRQVLVTMFVLFAVSGGLGVASSSGEVFGTTLLFLLGGLTGALLGHAFSTHSTPGSTSFHDRLIYAATGFVCMLPAFAAGSSVSPQLSRLIIPLTASLLLFDWTDRIRMGRWHIIQGGQVFWHGFVAALFTTMACTEERALLGGVLGAALLVLVQLASGVRPLHREHPAHQHIGAGRGRGHGRARTWKRVEGAYTIASTAVQRVGQMLENVADQAREAVQHPAADADAAAKPTSSEMAATPEVAGTQHEDQTVRAAEPGEVKQEAAGEQTQQEDHTPTVVVEGYQPSFVGRTANAGLSFLAKLLLLASLTGAMFYGSTFAFEDDNGAEVVFNQGRVTVVEGGKTQVDQQVSRSVILAPLFLGSIMLIVARRHDGAAHFVRGFFGCVLACITGVIALGPAARLVGLACTGHWNEFYQGNVPPVLILLAAIVVVTLLLLFWPKPSTKTQKPIVL